MQISARGEWLVVEESDGGPFAVYQNGVTRRYLASNQQSALRWIRRRDPQAKRVVLETPSGSRHRCNL